MASVRSRSLASLGQQRVQHPPGLLLKCTSRIIAISEATKSDGSGGCMTANAKIIRQESKHKRRVRVHPRGCVRNGFGAAQEIERLRGLGHREGWRDEEGHPCYARVNGAERMNDAGRVGEG